MSYALTTTAVRPGSAALLRWALVADAAVSAACGLLMLLGAEPLAALLGLPAALLRGAGLVLLPYAAFLAWLQGRNPVPRAAVRAVIACNLLWAADCVLLLAFGPFAPTGLGVAFVVVQAAAVLALAEAQYFGLKRAR